MTFYDAINTCLRKYVVFSGRAGRAEFWWFIGAVYFWFTFAAYIVAYANPESGPVLFWVLGLVLICPVLAVFWRRYHDFGFPGWSSVCLYFGFWAAAWAYWAYIPFELYEFDVQFVLENAAWLAPLLIAFLPSQPGPNKYGPNPHEVTP